MRRLIAISLALLMLIISLKVSVDFHYCSGKLAQSKIVIGAGNATCGMEESENSCKTYSSNSSNSFNKGTCCENQFNQIKTDDFQSVENFAQPVFEYYSTTEHINLVSLLQGFKSINFKNYKIPPDITSVSLPVIGVFLI